MWECGLKHKSITDFGNPGVTPYVGVWIETTYKDNPYLSKEVTPYVGVWIETVVDISEMAAATVTPYVGVWIETEVAKAQAAIKASLLMWECGLKP